MTATSYKYRIDPHNEYLYFFLSEGEKGKILKAVYFERLENDLWNLSFGHWQDGFINTAIISNNNDVMRTISTVVEITTEFLVKYPERRLKIEPVDEKRKRLYNHAFRRHYDVFTILFNITGFINDQAENYSPDKIYDIFEVKLKLRQ